MQSSTKNPTTFRSGSVKKTKKVSYEEMTKHEENALLKYLPKKDEKKKEEKR